MAALIKKNELEKYLRTHKCNKTYIVHIKETLRKKHIYPQHFIQNYMKEEQIINYKAALHLLSQ